MTDFDTKMAMRFIIALAVSMCLHGVVFESIAWIGGKTHPVRNEGSDNAIEVRLRAPDVPVSAQSVEASLNENAVDSQPLGDVLESSPLVAAEEQLDTGTNEALVMPSRGTAGDTLGPWYFTSRYLHRRPSPLRPVQPAYPEGYANIRGRVLLLLYIGNSGAVDKFEVVESEPKGVFDDSTIQAFTSVQYQPGLITGYAVRSQLLVEVTYDPGLPPQAALTAPEQEK